MSELRNKLSVDYLKQSVEEKSPSEQKSFLNQAVALYSYRIVELLGRSPDGTAQLHSIVEQLGIPITDALQVTDYLSNEGLVRIVQRDDRFGNHLISITNEGRRFITLK